MGGPLMENARFLHALAECPSLSLDDVLCADEPNLGRTRSASLRWRAGARTAWLPSRMHKRSLSGDGADRVL